MMGGGYKLDQVNYIATLEILWVESRPHSMLHHNYQVRVYGMITAKEKNREIYQKLVEDCTSRHHIDNPLLSLKHFFHNIAFEFNNENVLIRLPDVFLILMISRTLIPTILLGCVLLMIVSDDILLQLSFMYILLIILILYCIIIQVFIRKR